MNLKRIVSLASAAVLGLSLIAPASFAEVPSATYVSAYNSMSEVLAAGEALNLKIASEGMVLLKNEAALPLSEGERSVTLLGTAVNALQTGGAGSGRQLRPGGEKSDYTSAKPVDLFRAFAAAGIQVNPAVQERYLSVESQEIPGTGGSDGMLKREGGYYETILYDMAGIPLDDERWDSFLNQLTWDEMFKLASSGQFLTEACPTIGKPIYSDNDVTGASLYAALASESDTNKDLVIASDGDFGYLFVVNGESLSYNPVNVGHTGEPFHEFLISEYVSLKAGENVIQLITNNTTPMGGTMKASAPTVDFIRLDKLGDAQLTWAPVYDNIR